MRLPVFGDLCMFQRFKGLEFFDGVARVGCVSLKVIPIVELRTPSTKTLHQGMIIVIEETSVRPISFSLVATKTARPQRILLSVVQ